MKALDLVLDDPWFASTDERPDTPLPASIDPELDGAWFAKGQPLSSRPPPPELES